MSSQNHGARGGEAGGDRGAAADRLAALIASREARVAVIGLGYVGLPLLDAVVDAGFGAIGLDHDAVKTERLGRGENYLPHLGAAMAERLGSDDRVTLTSDPAALADADVVVICVPTPLTEDRQPDLGAVERAAREIAERVAGADPARPRLVVLESTTYPGTTREVVAGAIPGEAVFIAFSPEREDPANREHTTRTIPKLVGGVDGEAARLAELFYGTVVDRVVPCSSAEVAEAAKLVENVYRAVNIALVNELKLVFDAMGLDVWEVLDAAATKPFGFSRFDPGPGWGGHCVPIDPYYLAWRARRAGMETAFIELAGEINRKMPAFVADRCAEALASAGTEVEGASVLVLGIAYKRDVGDVRESPAFELIELLRARGASVSYHDPHVPETWPGRRHDLGMRSVAWSAAELAKHDLVVIVTDHGWYDWGFVAEHARLVVDTRNALGRAGVGGGERVWKA